MEIIETPARTFLFMLNRLSDMAVPNSDDCPTGDIVAETLTDHSVRAGYLFGSHARGDAHDVAVAFDDDHSSRLTARLALGADLALALGTDDVDVVDLERAPLSLVRVVFRDGDRLVGSESAARRLRAALRERNEEDPRSPAERFDNALAAIDDHLA